MNELIEKIRDMKDIKLSANYAERRYIEGYYSGYEQAISDVVRMIRTDIEVKSDE